MTTKEQLKLRAFDKWNGVVIYSKHYSLSEFFRKLEYLEAGGNEIELQLFTGYKDKNKDDIYFGDKIRMRLEDKTEPGGGFWWYATVESENGTAVLKQIGFDYSKCEFPDDYTFLANEADKCELTRTIKKDR